MNLESPKVTLDKSAQEIFDFLNNVENFEKLMPDNISKFEVLGEDKFLFALKGMPEIILKRKEVEAPNKIVLGAAGGKLDFSLTGLISQLDTNKSEVNLSFAGDFNPMMAMMVKGPLTKFLETLAGNMSSAI
ncbi:MAG: SRPBCC family protein [Flavobacteriaceae bacterium]|nr:SRPBCC family protein [Flavobacteriaceae bacterium]